MDGIISFIVGILVAFFLMKAKEKRGKSSYSEIISKAEKNAERIRKDSVFKAKEEMQHTQKQIKESRLAKDLELSSMEKRLLKEEIKLKSQQKSLNAKETQLSEKEKQHQEKLIQYDTKLNELNRVIEKEMSQLENIAQFTKSEAKEWVIKNVYDDARATGAERAMNIKNEMKERANREAKDILSKAIENMAYEYTIESTLTNIAIPNNRIKGMIIGRDGRNVKSFEEATGIKIIIDDTPDTVTLSGYDPIKRDIAGRILTELIRNKNINPNEISRLCKKKKQDIEREMRKAASDCLKMLHIRNVSDEMFEMLGRLKYRTSYGQNILQHSMEVAKLAGYMAGELGLDTALAKRAGLFHDLGKANSHDAEASHVAIGVEVATRAKEHPVVVNAILSHHEEAEPISPISVLVNAADKISGSRPGARRDSLEQYTKRIQGLEKIASTFKGVRKVFALSAGREIRVIVEPEEVTDAIADMLSSDIAKEIQDSLEYPGTIKVTIIRRSIVSALTESYVGQLANEKQNYQQKRK